MALTLAVLWLGLTLVTAARNNANPNPTPNPNPKLETVLDLDVDFWTTDRQSCCKTGKVMADITSYMTAEVGGDRWR